MNAPKFYAARTSPEVINPATHDRPRMKAGVSALLSLLFLLAAASAALAQREYTTVEAKVEKARARAATERIVIKTVTKAPTEGVLAVVLDPIIPGEVVVEDAGGKVVAKAEADKTGQAEFTLKRGVAYRVKATAPGFTSAAGKSVPLAASATVRLKLTAQFAALKLVNLPEAAQVFIDDQLKTTADKTGSVTIADLAPGKHKLTIRHPEYDEFSNELGNLAAGDLLSYPSLPLVKVARLTVQTMPGALVMIDGALKGKAEADGKVLIKYELDKASEHSISIALLGYQDWVTREMLTPGAKNITAKLEPIVTSAGVSDTFDDLSLWSAPASWKLAPVKMPNGRDNRKLTVSGEQLGVPKGTLYRDFDGLFEIRLNDGRGATWAMRIDKSGRNYYLFHLAGPKSETPKKFYTYLVKDGQMTQVSTPIPVIADLNQKDSYTIRLSVRGHRIQHWIVSNSTGEENDLGIYTDISDTKNSYLYGTFGFRSLKGETFTVDDFSIQPAKENEKVGMQ
ncbi:MAG TPA: carboxypeptidase-like regulatory domain-containing protein [Blastocatellia bacterium]|nr:carboxypeptidase-like regulatory domain-containing protein [Blastocatellia bacterium]